MSASPKHVLKTILRKLAKAQVYARDQCPGYDVAVKGQNLETTLVLKKYLPSCVLAVER